VIQVVMNGDFMCTLLISYSFLSFLSYEWQKYFIWDHGYEDAIRRNFEDRSDARLRDFLDKAMEFNNKPTRLHHDHQKAL